jgi:hypothetical protein
MALLSVDFGFRFSVFDFRRSELARERIPLRGYANKGWATLC